MRRQRFLRRVTARATALFLVLIVCAGLGHSSWDDLACDPIPVHHDHNAHRFQSGHLPKAPADEHCLVCHALRSLRSGLVMAHAVVADGAQIATVSAVDAVLSGRVLDSTAPSRAPPASLL